MKKIGILMVSVVMSYAVHGQVVSGIQTGTTAIKSQKKVTPDTSKVSKEAKSEYAQHMAATPVKSHLTYTALTQFVQSTVTTGTNGGINFKSSLFGLHYLFDKKNDSLSQYYLKQTGARNTQFSFGINKASTTSDQISRITTGITFAPYNKRDKSYENFAVKAGLIKYLVEINDKVIITKIIYTTRSIIEKSIRTHITDKNLQTAALEVAENISQEKLRIAGINNWTHDDIDTLFTRLANTDAGKNNLTALPALNTAITTDFDSSYTAIDTNNQAYADTTHKAKVDNDYKKIADSVFAIFSGGYAGTFKDIQKKYNDYAKKVDMGGLFTISLNPGYNIQKTHWDTTTVALRFMIGLWNPDKPLNLDLQANLVSLQDSTTAHQNFGHNKLAASLGLDKIFARDTQDNPIVEAEFAGEFDDVLSNRFPHEKPQVVTANVVASFHLSKQFTLPITLKYDPTHNSLLGFLSVQWNLESGGSNSNGAATTGSSTSSSKKK